MPRRIVLGCTGSVAAIKIPEIVEELTKLIDVSTAKLVHCFSFVIVS